MVPKVSTLFEYYILPLNSHHRALLTSELQEIFAHAPPAPNSVVNQRVRDAYARATGKASATAEEANPMKKRRAPGLEDDCPICYEGMHGADEKTLIWCETCANAVHKECFTQCMHHLLPALFARH
jgi:hypothetical protein